MRNSLVLATVAALALCGTAAAQQNAVVPTGQPQNVLHGKVLGWTPDAEARVVDTVNCSLLKNNPMICVNNDSDKQITNLLCEWKGFFGGSKSSEVKLPPGGVAPHTSTVVMMPGCKGTVVFTLPGGKERRLPNVDSDKMTEISVPLQ